MIVSILFRLERDEWLKEIQTKPNLRTYQLFKQEYGPESYTNILTSRAHRSFLAKLRGGSAPLEIETGRYVGAPADQRTCKLCHTAEAHFMLTCPVLHLDRLPLLTYISHTVSDFEHYSVVEQMCAIMDEANKSRRVQEVWPRCYMLCLLRDSIYYMFSSHSVNAPRLDLSELHMHLRFFTMT